MKIKTFITNCAAILLALVLSGTAVAGENQADRNEFNFNATVTKSDITAKSFVYDQDYWQQANSLIDDSGDQYSFDAPITKADIAAKNFVYDRRYWEQSKALIEDSAYEPVNTSREQIAEGSESSNALCGNC